jgi:hypothetical protein
MLNRIYNCSMYLHFCNRPPLWNALRRFNALERVRARSGKTEVPVRATMLVQV